jgi:hypothetical protein
MHNPEPPSLVVQLQELLESLASAGVSHAVIGGLAVNIHGHVRATHDLDLLIAVEDEPAVHHLMGALGYEAIDRRADLSSYVRGHERVDFLHAQHEISRKLLSESEPLPFLALTMPVISLEGLFAFKIQALNDDPRRLRDLSDMLELLRAAGDRLDLAEVRSYFRMFDREALLDELLRVTAEDRA